MVSVSRLELLSLPWRLLCLSPLLFLCPLSSLLFVQCSVPSLPCAALLCLVLCHSTPRLSLRFRTVPRVRAAVHVLAAGDACSGLLLLRGGVAWTSQAAVLLPCHGGESPHHASTAHTRVTTKPCERMASSAVPHLCLSALLFQAFAQRQPRASGGILETIWTSCCARAYSRSVGQSAHETWRAGTRRHAQRVCVCCTSQRLKSQGRSNYAFPLSEQSSCVSASDAAWHARSP